MKGQYLHEGFTRKFIQNSVLHCFINSDSNIVDIILKIK